MNKPNPNVRDPVKDEIAHSIINYITECMSRIRIDITNQKEGELLEKRDIINSLLKPLLKNGILNNGMLNNVTKMVDYLNEKKIQEDFNKQIAADDCDSKKLTWINCKGKFFKYFRSLVNQEIQSTLYMLKILTECVIETTSNTKYVGFTYDSKQRSKKDLPFNGNWDHDSKFFNIKITDSNNPNPDPISPRLIMAFGPSASGKSVIGQKIIDMLNEASGRQFPTLFLVIDGGEYRKKSIVYQTFMKLKNSLNLVFSGFNNMHGAIFNAGSIKSKITRYLKKSIPHDKHKKNNKIEITGTPIVSTSNYFSLYIPDTLTSCGLFSIFSCKGNYDDYIKISNDKAHIAMHIYQHKLGSDCDFKPEFKCEGCSASGKEREIIEGKKYSSDSYDFSNRVGKNELKRASGGQFIIHNSGNKDRKSVINSLIDTITLNGNKQPITNLNTFTEKYNFFLCPLRSSAAKKKGGNKTMKNRISHNSTQKNIIGYSENEI
jgi:hypothetical protein